MIALQVLRRTHFKVIVFSLLIIALAVWGFSFNQPTSAAPVVVFSDLFSEATDTLLQDHSPDTGSGWTRIIAVDNNIEGANNNSMKVHASSDELRRVTLSEDAINGCWNDDGVLYQTDDTMTHADYEVSVKQVVGDTLDDYNILAARIQDANNMYAFKWNEDDGQLYKRVSGVWITLGSATPGVANQSIVTLKVEGSTITVLDDGTPLVSVTDTDHPAAGSAGVGIGAVITAGDDCSSQRLDNFNVTVTGATLTIEKYIDPVGDPGLFNLQLDGNTELTDASDGDSVTIDVTADVHTVSEIAGTGTNLADYISEIRGDCALDGTIVLSGGDSKTCTIINTRLGSITIVKQTLPDGDPTDFDFSVDIIATLGDGDLESLTVAPGQYSVTETVPTGWELTSIICSDANSSGDTGTGEVTFNVEPGENVRCEFTNTKLPTLTIIKNTIAGDGEFDFNDPEIGDFSLITSGGTASTTFTLAVGDNYDVTEVIPEGWELTFDPNCSGTLAAGDEIECVFENTKLPTLTITKTTIGGDGTFGFNDSVLGSFELITVSGTAATTSELSVGFNYDVTEVVPEGWELTADPNCSGTLVAGEDKECIFENTKLPTLTVRKEMTNDNGGNAVIGDFNLYIDGSPVTSGVTTTVALGAHAVSEDEDPAYTATIGGACDGNGDVTLVAGEEAVCTITNDDQQATLIINKQVTNNNGGWETPQDFTIYVDATNASKTEFQGSPTGTTVYIDAGSYLVTEEEKDSYTVVYDNCSGEVEVGDEVVCTIYNNDIAPKLTVQKIVINDNGGTATTTDFTLYVDGFVVDHDVMDEYQAGAHTITEDLISGYEFVEFGGDCNPAGEVWLNPGDVKACTITNDDEAPTITLIKVPYDDHNGSAGPNDFGLTIGGTPVDSGKTLVVDANTAYALDEAGHVGYSFVEMTGEQCPANLGDTATLLPGESIECTIYNDDDPGELHGMKFEDLDGDGVKDPGEPGLEGWTIRLRDISNNVLDTTVTDVTGNYWFTGLAADDYRLTEVLQAGWERTVPVSPNRHSVTLANGEVVNDLDFGNYQLGEIHGMKFEDLDGDGIKDPGESGLENWTINLGGDGSDSTSTDVDGNYWFTDLPLGSYEVSEDQQTGWEQTMPVGNLYEIAIDESGEVLADKNFGNYKTPILTVIKEVIPDNGGDEVVGSFQLYIDGNHATSSVSVEVSMGVHVVSEDYDPEAYTAVIGGDCDANGNVTLASGEDKTCTITNDDIAPTITLIKNVINDHYGIATENDFGLRIDGNLVSSGATTTVDANTSISIDEDGDSDYTFVSMTGDAKCPAVLGGLVTLDEGEDLVCTITNDDKPGSISGMKFHDLNANGIKDVGEPGLEGWKIVLKNESGHSLGTTTTDINGDYEFNNLNSNEYQVSEAQQAGWVKTEPGGPYHPVTLDIGETAIRNFGNYLSGTIIVEKQTLPDGDSQQFNFTGDTSGTIGDGDQIIVSDLLPGTYSSTETVPSGWDLTDIICDDGNSSGDTGTGITTFNLEAGETVICTFENTKKGKIIIEKQTLPDGDSQEFDFSGEIVATLEDGETAEKMVEPGQYQVTESEPSGWDLTDIICDDSNSSGYTGTGEVTFNVEPGETVTCTFENSKRGKFILEKIAIGGDDDFGFEVETGLPMVLIYPNTILSTVGGFASVVFEVPAGNIFGAEEVEIPNGWELTTDPPCGGIMEPGVTTTCTFVNTKLPTLTVIKELPNDSGGDAVASVWTCQVTDDNDNDAVVESGACAGDSGTTYELTPGTYSVSETGGPDGYADSYSNNCEHVILEPGDDKTCTITNDDEPNTISGQKFNDLNANGIKDAGEQGLEGWKIRLRDGSNVILDSTTTNVNGDYSFTDLSAGDYRVHEVLKAGWIATVPLSPARYEITLSIGEVITDLDFGNYEVPTLTVIKEVVTDNGGTATADEWTCQVTDDNDSNTVVESGACAGDSGTSYELMPGTYSVSETGGPSGYASDKSADCEAVVLNPGDHKTCIIVNDDISAQLTVYKEVITDNGGNETVPDFPLYIDGNPVVSGVPVEVTPGAYVVSEDEHVGYDAVISGDCDVSGNVSLALGATSTCTITNDDQPASITLIKNPINDNGGDAGVDDFGLSICGTPVNSGDMLEVDANTPCAIDEDGLAGYEFVEITGDAQCPDVLGGTVTLDEGEEIECTIVNQDLPGSISGMKFHDLNGDGIKDADEPGLEGWRINLRETDNTLIDHTLTDVDGNYSFTNIAAGDYRLNEKLQAGWARTVPVSPNRYNVTLANGENATDYDFGNIQTGTIIIEKQTDPDGAGKVFEFTGDASGSISDGEQIVVTDLLPGQYETTETDPTNWELTDITCDDDNSTGDVNSGTATINLEPGEIVICTFENTKLSSITIEKQTLPNSDPEDFEFTGDVAGLMQDGDQITITDLLPGQYTSTEAEEAGWNLIDITCVEDKVSNSSGATSTRVATFNLEAGESVTCVFTNAKHSAIEGNKFYDLNTDTAWDIGEPGLEGWTILLKDGSGTSIATTTTDSDGYYIFSPLDPGEYQVHEVQQDGWIKSEPGDPYHPVTLGADEVATRHFGNYQLAGVSGMKFSDLNGDGIKDAGELGLEGWTIKATKLLEEFDVDSANSSDTLSSALSSGTDYVIEVSGTYTAGDSITADAKYSVRAPNTIWTDDVQNYEVHGPTLLDLQIDGSSPAWGAYNAGHEYSLSLTGTGASLAFKANDINYPGNVGLLHVKIYEVSAEAVTDVNGDYSFAGLSTGDYILSEVQQSGWLQTMPTGGDPYYLTLSVGDILTGYDFGNYQGSAIRGFKYKDDNISGTYDEGEAMLKNWTMRLWLDGVKIATTSTDLNGEFEFVGLLPGTYEVDEWVKNGWVQTEPMDPDYYEVVITESNEVVEDLAFGNYQPNSISGIKFEDMNGDGIYDEVDDVLLEGWEIILYDGEANKLASTTTDVDGEFLFFEIDAGDYKVEETMQDGWHNSTPDEVELTFDTNNASSSVIHFGNYQYGEIHGTKFLDRNNDGIWDKPDEEGIQGWAMFLELDGENIATTTTDADGEFMFDELAPGKYKVAEEEIDGWTQTKPANASGKYTVNITSGKIKKNRNFGNYIPASINGMKFEDINGNGFYDEGEPGLPDWKIRMKDLDTNIVTATTTDELGRYSFIDVPGNINGYKISEKQKDGWTQTAPFDPDTYTVPVGAGDTWVNVDFGNFRHATVTGVKYEDINNNGNRDEGEPVIAGWNIRLFDIDDNPIATSTTDAEGIYFFDGLEPGEYILREVAQDDWYQSEPGLVPWSFVHKLIVNVSGKVYERDFGNYRLGSIAGRKYQDVNFNKQYDSGVDVLREGWTIKAKSMRTGDEYTDVTNAIGKYKFNNLVPGTYMMIEEMQDGWIMATPNVFTVDLMSNQDMTGVHFGNNRMCELLGGPCPTILGEPAALAQGEGTELGDPQNVESFTGTSEYISVGGTNYEIPKINIEIPKISTSFGRGSIGSFGRRR